ncbi:MAG: ATP-binding cassette domain-containing protein [Legionellaceae bacterium]|nr:ATP-binding cassette domain-containing protein [Legionellaceae bacterium]
MLDIKNLTKSFPNCFKPVLQDFNLHLEPGDFCVVIGSNGSGKSTLLKSISGEYKQCAGKLRIKGELLTNKNRSHMIASVTQDVNKGTIIEMTMMENMALSLARTKKSGLSLYHRHSKQIYQEIAQVGMGLEHYFHQPLSNLSGGQRQMVATIMAVTSNPQLLLLDEHTSALDPNMQRIVMDYTNQSILKRRLTSLMITHNLSDAIQYGNRLIMLHKGKIVFDVFGADKSNLKIEDLLDLFHNYEDSVLLEAQK